MQRGAARPPPCRASSQAAPGARLAQVEVLKRLRQEPGNARLRDALLVSINGIAAGMRNTG